MNCVCPGNTDTNISKAVENLELTKKQEELVSNAPKQRLVSLGIEEWPLSQKNYTKKAREPGKSYDEWQTVAHA